MYKFFIFPFFFLLHFSQSNAQRFPVPVLPESHITIESSKGIGTIKSGQDTLWIFNGSQFKAALTKAKQLELAEEQILRYNLQAEIYKERNNEKDSLIAVLERDRDYYKNSFKMCTEDIEREVKRNKRKSLFNKFAVAGIPVAFVLGYLLAK